MGFFLRLGTRYGYKKKGKAPLWVSSETWTAKKKLEKSRFKYAEKNG